MSTGRGESQHAGADFGLHARQADGVGVDGASQLRKDRAEVSVALGFKKRQRLNRIDSGREHPDVASRVGTDRKQQSEVIIGGGFRR
jgi:hypothetical protein